MFTFVLPAAADPLAFVVHPDQVLREGADRFVGININYIRDLDINRPEARPLNLALKQMGVRWLRYPGGEKSNYCEWSQPPFQRPNPVSLGIYAAYPGVRMDFDSYIKAARAVDAEPFVVVGFGPEEKTGHTEQQWIDSAAAWVRYANVVKHDNVRYWEIGNENFNAKSVIPEQMAAIVADFSLAMKAVDPTIQIGASGDGGDWWPRFLPTASPFLDFVTLSLYNCYEWKSYDRYTQQPAPDLTTDVQIAEDAIDRYASTADRSRLRVVVAETNSKDYSINGWPPENTLGHGVVLFDTLGQLMEDPRVVTAIVWTTRWMNDLEAHSSQWYALDSNNELTPIGEAIALWGQFLQERLVGVAGGSPIVSAYASCSDNGRRMTVWVLNKGETAVNSIGMAIDSKHRYKIADIHVWSGSGPGDENPGLVVSAPNQLHNDALSSFSCPATSVTVFQLR